MPMIIVILVKDNCYGICLCLSNSMFQTYGKYYDVIDSFTRPYLSAPLQFQLLSNCTNDVSNSSG